MARLSYARATRKHDCTFFCAARAAAGEGLRAPRRAPKSDTRRRRPGTCTLRRRQRREVFAPPLFTESGRRCVPRHSHDCADVRARPIDKSVARLRGL